MKKKKEVIQRSQNLVVKRRRVRKKVTATAQAMAVLKVASLIVKMNTRKRSQTIKLPKVVTKTMIV